MATPKNKEVEAAVTTEKTAPVAVDPMVTYRDKVYTSRTLILPEDRELHVLRGRVAVLETDAEALDYLKGHKEFELLKE